jgi:hypothetical protein
MAPKRDWEDCEYQGLIDRGSSFFMPRQKLYKTNAEKQEANRAKSKRSYLKLVILLHLHVDLLTKCCRNKEAIASRRRKARNREHKAIISQELTQLQDVKGSRR